MKIKIYFIVILILTFPLNNYCQQLNSAQAVKSTLIKLFDLSKKENFTEAASLIAYTGKDENRKYYDTLNPDDKPELNQVKRICMQIFALLDLSKYEIGNYSTNKKDNLLLHSLEVHFTSGEQELAKIFNFVQVNNKYLLIFIE
ncbi:MAG: hypothetical protein A2V66_08545 [Ignavibacteria bacterium RBG_13_36_8]|nr:MAG: hypothetical protein A2V66_08545 [Ignavibacteria bacterium RBG_13_36_8]